MSGPSFTPGPWEVAGDRLTANLIVTKPGARCIARMDWPTNDEVDEANAQLIAAAPELYEALFEARISAAADVEEAECGEDGRYASFLPVFVERLNKIDAALAKARGETA